jgi:hypothetical protein
MQAVNRSVDPADQYFTELSTVQYLGVILNKIIKYDFELLKSEGGKFY